MEYYVFLKIVYIFKPIFHILNYYEKISYYFVLLCSKLIESILYFTDTKIVPLVFL